MINFDELRIKESEVLGKEQWNGLLDDTRRYFEGNVGLGTGSPKAKLHIEGKGGSNIDLLVNGSIRSDNNNGGLWISDDRFVGGTRTNRIGFFNNEKWRLQVESNGDVEISDNLNVRKNLDVKGGLTVSGNTGIGTANPMSALSLGSSLNTLKLALYQNNQGTSWYGMGVTAGRFYFNIGNPQAGYLFLDRAGSGAKEIFTIRGNGNVGIGNDNPGARLHVNGNIRASLNNIGSQRNARYNPTTGELGFETSTRRDKINITPLKDDFGKIMQLQPRKYNRPEDPKGLEIGYIAEEARSLGLDNLVFYNENGQPDGINYEKLSLYLVEIVRQHERRLNPGSPFLSKYIETEDVKPG